MTEREPTSGRRMTILGGGPIGLECLLRAVDEGWDATLYERGRVGENIRRWGHVRMFSPLAMNASEIGRRAAGVELDPEALPTGAELVAGYLEPLARSAALAGRIRTETEALAVSRDGLDKDEAVGAAARGERPFRVLLRDRRGERTDTADVVVDATGTFATVNGLGSGGIPAPGERAVAPRIHYRLPDMRGRDRGRFAGRTTLVLGAGHSAATAITWFAKLARSAPRTTVIWATRSQRERPVPEIADDPLPERERISRAANDAAASAPPWLERSPGSRVLEIAREAGRFRVLLADGGALREHAADEVLALVGYRPDLDLARELQVRTCWATEGTYPLAAALLARDGGADCLSAGAALGAETLLHPEPGFFTLGAKSYGRNSSFLIRAGLEQVDGLFELLRDA